MRLTSSYLRKRREGHSFYSAAHNGTHRIYFSVQQYHTGSLRTGLQLDCLGPLIHKTNITQ